MTKPTLLVLVTLAAVLGPVTPSLGVQPHDGTKSLAEQIAAIKKEMEIPNSHFNVVELADRLRKGIREHPDDPELIDGIRMLTATLQQPLTDDLTRLVLEKHAAHPKLGELCLDLRGRTHETWAERLIKITSSKHPLPEVRGQATYALAEYNRWRAKPQRGQPQPTPEDSQRWHAMAEELYQEVIKTHADVRSPVGGVRLGDLANTDLARLRNQNVLAIGKVAPEIQGLDVDGQPMRLSEHRGKVVVLLFWGTWCPPCQAMQPHLRGLVKRLEGRRFALVGVNTDNDKAMLKDAMKREGMTWRSWWDRSTSGPIAAAWEVTAYPTIYVLDHKGVIRVKNVRDKKMDEAVDELLKELDEGKDK